MSWKIFQGLPICLLFVSCFSGDFTDVIVYSNDFESTDISLISGGKVSEFEESIVLGNYNNQEISLDLKNLPKHKFVDIKFQLLIHDSWDGNKVGTAGPDIWGLKVEEEFTFKSLTVYNFETTFSNSSCGGSFCLRQSYPYSFPHSTEPKTGTDGISPGLCSPIANPEGTTLYQIHKVIKSQRENIKIKMYDRLIQENAEFPSCDESWSIDNILITVIK